MDNHVFFCWDLGKNKSSCDIFVCHEFPKEDMEPQSARCLFSWCKTHNTIGIWILHVLICCSIWLKYFCSRSDEHCSIFNGLHLEEWGKQTRQSNMVWWKKTTCPVLCIADPPPPYTFFEWFQIWCLSIEGYWRGSSVWSLDFRLSVWDKFISRKKHR